MSIPALSGPAEVESGTEDVAALDPTVDTDYKNESLQ